MNKQALAIALSIALSGVALAGDFQSELVKRFPNTAGSKVEKAWPGFYAVIKGSEVVFINKDFTILVNGDVIDLKSSTSLTNKFRPRPQLKRVDTHQLDVKDAIKISDGSRRLYIFSDPDCPFCRRLEPDIEGLPDTAVYIFPIPLEGLHPNAPVVTRAIVCSDDPAGNWKRYAATQEMPAKFDASDGCARSIERNLAKARELGINGTPSLIFEDGTIVPGLIPRDQIIERINKAAAPESQKPTKE